MKPLCLLMIAVFVGAIHVLLEKYHTSFINGSFNYVSGGYYRVIGSDHLWGGLYYVGEEPTVGFPGFRMRCYKDADYEIFITDLHCSFPSAVDEQIDPDQLKLYPNPVRNLLQIEYNASLSGANYRLLNQLGGVVMSGVLPPLNTPVEIAIDHLPNGIWWLEVVNENKRGMWKIVKM